MSKARDAMKTSMKSRPVAIFGAGTQGRRLAYMWSSLGGPVNIIDRDQSQLDNAKAEVQRFRFEVGESTKHQGGKISTFMADDRKKAIENAWLIVECVPESLKLKRDVVADLDTLADLDTIIASNSSSYTVSEIVLGLSLKHAERMASLHSYWPPETPAIEVMASKDTKPDIISLLMEQCGAHGFSPFHVRKDSNGYICNRIWAAIKREALLVAAEEVATPAEVDGIFKDVLKTPKGPFEQMDIVGLDVVLAIEEHYAKTRGGLPEKPRDLLKVMIEKGKLGVKNGHGFYDWDGAKRVNF